MPQNGKKKTKKKTSNAGLIIELKQKERSTYSPCESLKADGTNGRMTSLVDELS